MEDNGFSLFLEKLVKRCFLNLFLSFLYKVYLNIIDEV